MGQLDLTELKQPSHPVAHDEPVPFVKSPLSSKITKVGTMKKNLILTVIMFVMLAIGIGVGRVFSQGEDAKAQTKSHTDDAKAQVKSHSEDAKTHAKTEVQQISKSESTVIKPQTQPEQVPQPPTAEPS